MYTASKSSVGCPLMYQEGCRTRESCKNVFHGVVSHEFLRALCKDCFRAFASSTEGPEREQHPFTRKPLGV